MSDPRFEWMLVSDLDGTLLGDDASLASFQRTWEGVIRPHGCLVYASGRFIASMRRSVETTGLPEPDFWIGGVGTEIEDSEGQTLHEWRKRLDDGWNRSIAMDTLEKWPGVKLQPDEFMSAYKVSGYWYDAKADDLKRLGSVLASRGCHARVLYSSNRDVDVLPSCANKGSSAAFVASGLGIGLDQIICSGDSGNDADLFRMGFGGGILVGNAAEELMAVASSSAYRAVAPYAAGVLEGLRHFGRLKPA